VLTLCSVHEYNTECLVLTYLPYHNAPQFLALLSILPPNPKPALRFLHPYIQSPTNPPRRTIVYTAVNTPAFFNAFQNYMVKVLEAGHQGSSLLSFWSSVTTQSIDGILDQSSSGKRELRDQKTEELLLRVLPVLNACMRSGNGAEAVTACYMIAIVLVTKASFEDKILDTIMEAAIISQDNETLDACLVCLSVLAEERSKVQLPRSVLKRLLRVPNLSRTFVSLSKRCRIDRLTLGAALGALENIEGSEESQQIFREIIESNLLDEPQLLVALSALVQVVRRSEHTSSEHSHLIDYASRLSDIPVVPRLLEAAAKKTGTDLGSLGLIFGSSLENEPTPLEVEDEEMLDAEDDQINSAPLVLPPEIREISFLATKFSETFQATQAAFNQAVASNRAGQFLNAESLQQHNAFKTPLYFSFLVRVWCSQDPVMTRIAALRSATALINSKDQPVNLQNLIPYLLYALADSSATVRRSAVACTAALSAKTIASQKAVLDSAWGPSDLYGKDSSKMSSLSAEQLSGLLSVLVPMLEECAMDANFATTTLREALEGTQSTKASKHVLKAALRSHIISFLGDHATITPLISVRLRLLPLLSFVGKSSATVRNNSVLPTIRAWCSLPNTEVAKSCENEQIARMDAERGHITALVSRESESVNLLKDVISGKCSQDRIQLLDASFDWLVFSWPSIRFDSRLSLSLSLLDLALQHGQTEFEDHCRSRSLETLRAIKLDSSSLLSLLESVPSSVQMPEGPPTKKRRRTSRNEMARSELHSPDNVAQLLRRLTLVLEVIESSNPGEHPILFRSLFTVLGELQPLKQQSGSDLVYLQSLVLGSLTPIVNRIKVEKDTSEYQASVRADLLIDCIRHSASPQVQNAALLLIATLASWVPELILHNLMPIFTFIGSTLLRQQDDYSAHVVDQVRDFLTVIHENTNISRLSHAWFPPLLHRFVQNTKTSSLAWRIYF
jgi:U3 small nucleolar RNA-associated protein 10